MMTALNWIGLFLVFTNTLAQGAERADWDPFTRQPAAADLSFPTEPVPFERSIGTHLFKPDGPGPFPAIVFMPTCSSVFVSAWAEEALRRGYVALRVDPLGPRKVKTNCDVVNVRPARLMKDAFDAAAHLRNLPFVKPDRVGLFGFSQGGFVGLGASGETHWQEQGQPPFAAIVVAYPSCRIPNVVHPETGEHVDIVYAPARVRVPTLVEIGGRDHTGGLPRNGCDGAFDNAFAHGDPVQLIVYSAGHKWDQDGPPEVTSRSIRDAFDFADRYLRTP